MDDLQDFTEPVLGNGVDGGIFECSTCSLVHHRMSALFTSRDRKPGSQLQSDPRVPVDLSHC